MFQSKHNEFQAAIAAQELTPAMLRTCWIATRVARAIGMEAQDVADVASAIVFDTIQAQKYGLSENVIHASAHRDAHWDGKGTPLGLAGNDIHIAGRIARLASLVEAAYISGGANSAFAAVMQEASISLDPRLADSFLRLAGSRLFWQALESSDLASHISDPVS